MVRQVVIVVVLMVVMVVMMMGTMVMGTQQQYSRMKDPCLQMREECRVSSYLTADTDLLIRNVSCFCKYGEEVSHHLDKLRTLSCMNDLMMVNVSILHVVGCNVTSQAPLQSLLATFRDTSGHMELYVENSGWFSLKSPSSNLAPSTITATFINSKISGIPGGVVGGARVMKADVLMEGCEGGVLENYGFSHYPPDAQVNITFRDTSITTLQEGAFDLPREAQVEFKGGKVVSFNSRGFSGGAELTLDGVAIGKLLPASINTYGLRKLKVSNCTMAAVYHHALDHWTPTYDRNIVMGNMLTEESAAVFTDNKFLTGSGRAFEKLCSFAKIKWFNNTVLTADQMPLRLQTPECSTERDWSAVFSFNRISCENCSNFNPSDQTCALFQTSYCISCDTPMDGCGKQVLPYITSKCHASHPDVTAALSKTCTAVRNNRTPKALQGKDTTSSGASLTPLLLGVSVCLSVLMRVAV